MPTTGKLPSAGIYFHVPFCKKKCPYCHFYVVQDREDLQKAYLKALENEWHMVKDKLKGFSIVSIYFGGGTPSLLGPERISKILEFVFSSGLDIASDCEITLEANPENVTKDKMAAFASAGINRVSIGLQTLQEDLLQILGREHTADKSIESVYNTYGAGIKNISVDLMFELPHQDLSMWEKTLYKVRDLPITHLSLYNLVIEPHTVFFKQKKELDKHIADPETCKAMLESAVHLLEEAGLKRYEISAFAKEGYTSRHNTGYWKARPFIGLGPSAFSYFDKSRYQNVASINKYIQQLDEGIEPVSFREKLNYPDDINELLAVELRLLEGIERNDFEKRNGKIPPSSQNSLKGLVQDGLLSDDNERIKLTDKGLLFYDSVAERII